MPARIKIFISVILGVVFLAIFSSNAWAEVKINEFDSWETSGDWIEFYSTEDVDISGWILKDTTSTVKTITAGSLIGPSSSEFFIVEVGKRLNRDGDIIKLYQEDGTTLVNQMKYGDKGGVCAPLSGQTAGRLPDGSDNVTRFASVTKGMSNTAPEAPCPSPIPSPSPSPTPSPEPEPASEPDPSPSPSPTPVVVASPKVSPKTSTKKPVTTSLFDSHDSEEMLLSTEGGEILGSIEGEEASESGKEKSPYLIPIILGVLGLGLIGGTGVVFYKQRGYNGKHEEDGEI